MKNYKRSTKNFGKGLKGGIVAFAGVAMFVTPYTTPVGIGALAKGISHIIDAVDGNYVENSIIKVHKNRALNRLSKKPSYYVIQGLPNTKQYLESLISKNKLDFLKLQELNFLLGIDRCDDSGNIIEYNTKTHSGNYMMLKQLKKYGFIENLSKTKAEKRDFKFERLLIGNGIEKTKENSQYI